MSAGTAIWRKRSQPRHKRGFTLIELLVALTLFGLISIVVMGGLRFGTRVWESGDTRAQAVAEVEAVQGIIRRYMAQATRPNAQDQLDEVASAFIGESDRIRFVTINPASVGIGGLYLVEIAMGRGEAGDGGTLELMWRLFRPDAELPDGPLLDAAAANEEETAAAGRRTLLTGVRSLRFGYFGADDSGKGQSEVEKSWPDAKGLPDLIVLDVTFAAGSGRTWPRLVVQTRAAHAEQ